MADQLPRKNICPLLREPCLGLDCKWYLELRGTDPQDRDKDISGWDCAIVWNVQAALDVRKSVEGGLNGLQKAEESFRDTAWKETQSNLHDIVETVKHQTKFNTDILHRVGNGLAAVASAANTKLIGNTQHDVGD